MVNVNIEIPDELHRRLKIAAVMQDTTIKDLFLKILSEDASDVTGDGPTVKKSGRAKRGI